MVYGLLPPEPEKRAGAKPAKLSPEARKKLNKEIQTRCVKLYDELNQWLGDGSSLHACGVRDIAAKYR